MKVMVNRGLTYVPTWNGNKKLPKEEQVTVYYRYMTGPERESVVDPEMVFDENGKPQGNIKVRIGKEKIVRACVEKVTNLYVTEDGKDRLAVPEDILVMPELSSLYKELSDFLFTENEVPDKKK